MSKAGTSFYSTVYESILNRETRQKCWESVRFAAAIMCFCTTKHFSAQNVCVAIRTYDLGEEGAVLIDNLVEDGLEVREQDHVRACRYLPGKAFRVQG